MSTMKERDSLDDTEVDDMAKRQIYKAKADKTGRMRIAASLSKEDYQKLIQLTEANIRTITTQLIALIREAHDAEFKNPD